MHLADVLALCRQKAAAVIYAESKMSQLHQLAKSYLEDARTRASDLGSAPRLPRLAASARRASAAALRTPVRPSASWEALNIVVAEEVPTCSKSFVTWKATSTTENSRIAQQQAHTF